ncbi:MAG: NUDIX domain-containing protein [Rhodospirillales bacterium]|nr:NUDIX domain-containing protein [Rhodospirillales bacterium]
MSEVPSIKPLDIESLDFAAYDMHLADCIILGADGRIVLQQRPGKGEGSLPILSAFEGHVEAGETVMQGLVREIEEELGAVMSPEDITFIGAVSEDFTNHREVVHLHFWHDKDDRITGCYEFEALRFSDIEHVFTHPGVMDYVRWGLYRCKEKGLLS